ncbi:Twin-arginine translocation pathway signal [hydrothermal vent metagenome]|uniref:Twin-arginine translocation pathway signal n=1 Tax=hydrothermal vent metagenome TaxID=652676 RepID=A0A3B1E1P1_9ZZZZ
MNRRKFLKIVGGGVIVAAGTGIIGFFATRTPNRALKPWLDSGTAYTEPRERALSYAILTPNPHNRQPWKIDLSNPDTIKILVDTDQMLPHTDPFNRQITIGFGCFLEVLRMAAAQDGFRVEENLFPEGSVETQLDERPVAILKLLRDTKIKPDPLFLHVLKRRSLKDPYDLSHPISDKTLLSIEEATDAQNRIGTTNDPKMVEKIRQLTRQAMKIEIETPQTYKESVNLFRIGKKEIEANPDGIDFSGPLFESLALAGFFSREGALDRNSSEFKQGIAAVMENVDTAMGYVWLVSKTNTRIAQIKSGRDWVRINLATTGLGLGTHPLSQALQEYSEMTQMYKKLHEIFAPDGGTVQMLARLGFGNKVAASPRWALEKKIIGV